MSSFKVEDTESFGRCLRLPKPDPANITVLTPNLPNKPILPWTHFDSPWLDKEVDTSEEESETQHSDTQSQGESVNSESDTQSQEESVNSETDNC